MRRLAVVSLVLISAIAAADLKQLYEAHDWFGLRDAVRSPEAAPFYRVAVAAAFHDRHGAEKHLLSVIKTVSPEDAAGAHLLLVTLYKREGRFRKALPHLRAARKLKPERIDIYDEIRFFQGWPDQQVVRPASGKLTLRIQNDNMFVPVTVNGQERGWIFDTGANWCITTESEARRIRLEDREGNMGLVDASGKSTGARAASAREFKLGALKLRNVPFVVVRDDQEPFKDLPPDQRGIIGLTVILAAGSMSWDADGDFALGTPAPAGEPNLAFDGAMPITALEFAGRRIPVVLDTGADTTHLWPKFANEFAGTLATGARSTVSFSGVAHRVDTGSVTIPELPLRIGGKDLGFRNVHVLLGQEGDSPRCYYGNLGTDLLSAASRGTLDFRRMRLVIE